MLQVLRTSSVGWWRQRGHFRDDLVGGVYGTKDFMKRGLPAEHGTQLRISEDGQQVWFWRETVSGWVLGVGMASNDRNFRERLYSVEAAPAAGPLDNPEVLGRIVQHPA